MLRRRWKKRRRDASFLTPGPQKRIRRLYFDSLEARRVLALFVVNSTLEPGDGTCDVIECTLSEAITAANAATDFDTITFNIPDNDPGHVYYRDNGAPGLSTLATTTLADDQITDFDPDYPAATGPHSWFQISAITSPSTSFVTLSQPVTIDGYSQPGALPNTNPFSDGLNTRLKIELLGSTLFGTAVTGLTLESPNEVSTVIRGLAIHGFRDSAIAMRGQSWTVEGNFLGTDVTATRTQPPFDVNGWGVVVEGSNHNRIGTDGDGINDESEFNLISGNISGGIRISGNNNLVAGNLIGTSRSGVAAIANTGPGVRLEGGATLNAIGGDQGTQRNIISGNTGFGIEILGVTTSSNRVLGNYIGTNVTGTQALGNNLGVYLYEAPSNFIGGDQPHAGNLISGNQWQGIRIQGTASRDTVILGNLIGTDVTGTSPLGNGHDGIWLQHAAHITIGGDTPEARNVISGNLARGIFVEGAAARHNAILGNYVGTDVTGSTAIPNASTGIFLDRAAQTIIGGGTREAGNIVSGNRAHGIEINGVSIPTFQWTSGNGHHYAIAAWGSWADAEAAAVALGGHLASINSPEEQAFLESTLLAPGKFPNERFWIGLTDRGSQGNFRWTSGEPVTYTNWRPTEPSAGDHEFGAFNSDSSFHGQWGDREGNDYSRAIIELGQEPDAELFESVLGTGLNVIHNNFIGTNAAGTAALGNGNIGIVIRDSLKNHIGGPGAGNVISGNPDREILIAGANSTATEIVGNMIGSDVTGTVVLNTPNIYLPGGITIWPGVSGTVIGGTTPASRNLITGTSIGIEPGALSRIQGNYLGVDASGTKLLRVPGMFHAISGGTDVLFGGTEPGAGNVVAGWERPAVLLFGETTQRVTVQGNKIGVNATGTAVLGNQSDGIRIGIGASNNLIGGTEPGAGNIVAGNGEVGIRIDDAYGVAAHDNRVQGNLIGTDATGTVAFPNNAGGIHLGGTTGNLIGGTEPGARNVISGNNWDGVQIYRNTARFNDILGNYIGTDASGTKSLANLGDGVRIVDASQNIIGGEEPGARNVVSGNQSSGVAIAGQTATSNAILGNHIGTDLTGTQAIGNTGHGVYIVFAPNNQIGSSAPGGGNVIAANDGDGVLLFGGDFTRMQGNKIGTNVTGDAALGNGGSGIMIDNSQHNLVGGERSSDQNLISANHQNGVAITGPGSILNQIIGNLIGTDVTGTRPLGNLHHGIWITSTLNEIGANTPGARNVISGNAGRGIVIDGRNDFAQYDDELNHPSDDPYRFAATTAGWADSNAIVGNLIGTDVSGTRAISNGRGGVAIYESSGNIIGGTEPGDSNVIAGNNGDGLALVGAINTPIYQWSVGNGHYYLLTPRMSWSEAEFAANALGGHLVSITSHEEQGFLDALLTSAGYLDFFWTGLTDQEQNGEFHWSSGEEVVYTNWEYDGPNSNGFTVLSYDYEGSWRWYVRDDDETFGVGGIIELDQLPDPLLIAKVLGTGHNIVQANFVGTDATGAAILANAGAGIRVVNSRENQIGAGLAGNVVSGNPGGGIIFEGSMSRENVIAGNFVGTDVTGTLPLGNLTAGVLITAGAAQNRLGTNGDENADGAERNVISANTGDGVRIFGEGSQGNSVAGNLIGLDRAGIRPLGNSAAGVRIVDAANNHVGGSNPQGNSIAFNHGPGIAIECESATGNALRGNSIFQNGAIGIDVAADGITPNDNGDADQGPNQRQNHPLVDVAYSALEPLVAGRLESSPHQLFILDFFANSPLDAGDDREGRRYLGSTTVTTDLHGAAEFNLHLPRPTFNGESVSATATDALGNTSEFSPSQRVVDNILPTIDRENLVATSIGASFDQLAAFGVPTTQFQEGEVVRLDGLFDNADEDDIHTVTIDWGDGSPLTVITNIPPGERGFSGEHRYLDDDPSATPSDPYTIQVTVTDDEGATGTASIAISVVNVPPSLSELTVSSDSIDEGSTATITAQLSDPGTDRQVVMIDWGDGSARKTVTLNPGQTEINATHRYQDDSGGDRYSIRVHARDDDGGEDTGTLAVMVTNVAPSVMLVNEPASLREGESFDFRAQVLDAGARDTHVYRWVATKQGETVAVGQDSSFSFHPDDDGEYTITLTVADDDGAAASITPRVVTVGNVSPSVKPTDIILRDASGNRVTSITEGQTIFLSGTFADSGIWDRHFVEVDWGDGSTSGRIPLEIGSRSFDDLSHVYADDRPTGTPLDVYRIRVRVLESDTVAHAGDVLLTVTNAPPEVAILDDGSDSSNLRLFGLVTDAGDRDTFAYHWSVTGIELPPGTPTDEPNLAFPLPIGGTVRVTLVVNDDDTGTSTVQASIILGTVEPDEIHVTVTADNADDPDNVTITVVTGAEFVSYDLAAADQLLILGQEANDVVTIDASVLVPVLLDAGEGDDTITGGSGNDTLLGGTGDDLMVGSDGSDFLISDSGNDTLVGGLQDDTYQFLTFSQKVIQDAGGEDTLDFSRVDWDSADGYRGGVRIDLAVMDGTPQQVRSDGSVSLYGNLENVRGTAFSDDILGNDQSNIIFGGAGHDTISGGLGTVHDDDVLTGGEGNDVIVGDYGNDTLLGGEGDDSILGGGSSADGGYIFGGLGHDTIHGGLAGETIVGGLGNDVISGGFGSDTLLGGEGNDSISGGGHRTDSGYIFGGFGDDTIYGGSAIEILEGGEGDDVIASGFGNDTLLGGAGDDSIVGGDGASDGGFIFGGLGHDTIYGGAANDSIQGGLGNDVISGGFGSDTLLGGEGNDSILGSRSSDQGGMIFGGFGQDTIMGGASHEMLDGGEGNDVISGGYGHDTIFGGAGNDSILGSNSPSGGGWIFGGLGHDTIFGGPGNDSIQGGEGNDIITGGSGNDTLLGDLGNDSILGGSGNDGYIFGGLGNDTIHGSLGVSLLDGGDGDDIILGGLGDDTLSGGQGGDSGIGRIFGGLGNDTITGGTANETISGGAGNDVIVAGTGLDTVLGGEGNDVLLGATTEGGFIFGDEGHDTLTGGAGTVLLDGGDGDDLIEGSGAGQVSDDNSPPAPHPGLQTRLIFGGLGDDTIVGGTANDLIDGGDGHDVVQAGLGLDTILGGLGDDSLTGGDGNGGFIFGGLGDDTIVGGDAPEMLDGEDGHDVISAGLGPDTLLGGAGEDTLVGGGSSADGGFIFGGLGDDSILGGAARETLDGGGGNDVIVSGTGFDTILGGAGDDSLVSGTYGGGFIFGGSGGDTIVGGVAGDNLFGGEASGQNDQALDWLIAGVTGDATLTDSHLVGSTTYHLNHFERAMLIGNESPNHLDASGFSGNVRLFGRGADDLLLGGSVDDTLVGGAGDDTLVGGPGADTYVFEEAYSGSDTIEESPENSGDTLDFSRFPTGVHVDLDESNVQAVGNGLMLKFSAVTGIENVIGTAFADRISGNERDNLLIGGGGTDELDGRSGDDVLMAGSTRWVYLDFDTATESGEHVYTSFERNAIQAAIQRDFARFDIQVTQARPATRPLIEVFFNEPPMIDGRPQPGGEADQVGWRELFLGGRVKVDVNGFLGNTSNVLLPTTENFTSLSSTIASHELAHMFGLRHHDAFGKPGDGVFTWVTGQFLPGYSGPRRASETRLHLTASPASVRTTLIDALNDPFFGQREALKLAFTEAGTVTPELSDEHKLTLDVAIELPNGGTTAFQTLQLQPLGSLTPHPLPNTLERGEGAGSDLFAGAINVAGAIGLETLGAGSVPRSESDWYSFEGNAGDMVTIEVMSQILRHRIANPIDAVLRVYFLDDLEPSAGTESPRLARRVDYYQSPLKAFNDDGLEPPDALLLDLPLPFDGDYLIEVDTFNYFLPEVPLYTPDFNPEAFCASRPANAACRDQDQGQYELLLYKFGDSGTPGEGDLLIGGEGADRLIGNSGTERYFADSDDVLVDPSGMPTVAGQLRLFGREGQSVRIRVAAPNPQSSFSLLQGPSGASIDATTGVFHWLATDDGVFPIQVQVASSGGNDPTVYQFELQIADVAPQVFVTGSTRIAETAPYALRIGSITDPGEDLIQAYSIDWGDGIEDHFSTAEDGLPTGRAFYHQYANGPANHLIAVNLENEDGVHRSAGSKNIFVLNAAPKLAVAAPTVVVSEGAVASINGHFFDSALDQISLEVSVGEILPTGGGVWTWSFRPGDGPGDSQTVVVTATDSDGEETQLNFQLDVQNAVPMVTLQLAGSTDCGEPMLLTALISDAAFGVHSNLPAETFNYDIDWGDGGVPDAGRATIQTTGQPGVATIATFLGEHVYAESGTYLVRTTITDDDGGVTIVERQILISTNVPRAAFTVSPSPVAAGDSITFDGGGSTHTSERHRIVSYSWDFGDGSTYTESASDAADGLFDGRTTHAYRSAGSFAPQMTVADDNVPPKRDAASASVTVVPPVVNRLFDFDLSSGNTRPGYLGVLPNAVYSPANGYGWATAVKGFDSSTYPDLLLRDGHLSTRNTFKVDLPAGRYDVTVTLGDATYTHDKMDVLAGGTTVLTNLSTSPGKFIHRTFTTTLTEGPLTIEFVDRGGGDPNFALNGITIRSAPRPVIELNGPESILANQVSTATISTSSNLPAGALVTVATTLGTISTADASSAYAGTQVVVGQGGSFSFLVTSGPGAGVANITAEEISGAAIGSTSLRMTAPAVRRFDFNAASNQTAPGYTAVLAGIAYTPERGYGWKSWAQTFDRSQPDTLRRDGHLGSDNTFFVQVDPGQPSYTVTAVLGDYTTRRDNVEIYVDGELRGTVTTEAGNFASFSTIVTGATITDGLLEIRFVDKGGVNSQFAVCGIDIGTPLRTMAQVEGSIAKLASADAIASIIREAVSQWTATDLMPEQKAKLAAVDVRIEDLAGPGYLALADGALLRIDDDAAGQGWFVDPTPDRNEEFQLPSKPHELSAIPGSPASRHVDLLTVITHELGHVMGLPDLEASQHPGELMSELLAPGTRRTIAVPSTHASHDLPAGHRNPRLIADVEQAFAANALEPEWSIDARMQARNAFTKVSTHTAHEHALEAVDAVFWEWSRDWRRRSDHLRRSKKDVRQG